ncbi:hypothetical protein E2562_004610 [Oryza meyeriana var. granulata]|uniref:Uncharacterized protein n=1 Tax=Oryza meyeriana var. granulata TaxID=110450 RepID=A0A6G1F3S4_9ORYZ|nr:hypothetical protein E2562_004610 [Oryza meyeriana var. granulata]
MGMGGVQLQASSCFVRSSRSVLCHGLSACCCPSTGSSELDGTEDDGGVYKSEEAERFHQGHPSLSSMSASLPGPPAPAGCGAAGGEAADIHSSSSR